mgnify:CR=1 FL=1
MTGAQDVAWPMESELQDVLGRCNRIKGRQDQLEKDLQADRQALAANTRYLDISDRVTDALKQLNSEIFREEINKVEDLLTKALQDVLDQPIVLKAKVDWKRNAASVSFEIEREGNAEHIMRGQGGSVSNILSVGLRIFALHSLGEDHRKLLVLDEQDCWLRPDRVPELMRLVRQAATKLGFQMIVISHHDEQLFAEHADRIFQIIPQQGGKALVKQLESEAPEEDSEL